jgi:hypothetical protein
MSKSSVFETEFLKLIFNGTAIANLADNAAVAPLTNIYLALHTADPGNAGNQTTSEVAYTGYARVAVARTAGGWVVTASSVSPAAVANFPAMTAGVAGTATHASIGTAVNGAGKILWSGALTPTIGYANGVTPQLPTTSAITED